MAARQQPERALRLLKAPIKFIRLAPRQEK